MHEFVFPPLSFPLPVKILLFFSNKFSCIFNSCVIFSSVLLPVFLFIYSPLQPSRYSYLQSSWPDCPKMLQALQSLSEVVVLPVGATRRGRAREMFFSMTSMSLFFLSLYLGFIIQSSSIMWSCHSFTMRSHHSLIIKSRHRFMTRSKHVFTTRSRHSFITQSHYSFITRSRHSFTA